MRKQHLNLLVCPACHHNLALGEHRAVEADLVEEGTLTCSHCADEYPIIRGVPRFVPLQNYADGFDFQWNKHALTQHDSYSQSNVSQERFFNETQWDRRLDGEFILEVGCGSGRFTAQALSTGATVVATDLSGAVDANHRIHQGHPNLLIVQSDLYKMPFPRNHFDRLFCIGVLQHTPDVERSFRTLPDFLKPGGSLVTDVYDKHTGLLGFLEPFYRTYRWFRPITKRMPPEQLYKCVSAYISTMWPIASQINRIPRIGPKLNRMLLITDYRGRYPLSEELLKEWSILDTFDMLNPAYDQRQTIHDMRKWFQEAPLTDIDVHYGYNGIVGRGMKC